MIYYVNVDSQCELPLTTLGQLQALHWCDRMGGRLLLTLLFNPMFSFKIVYMSDRFSSTRSSNIGDAKIVPKGVVVSNEIPGVGMKTLHSTCIGALTCLSSTLIATKRSCRRLLSLCYKSDPVICCRGVDNILHKIHACDDDDDSKVTLNPLNYSHPILPSIP